MNEDESTPLHVAAENGDAEDVTALVNAGVAPDAQDKYGRTPLHVAAQEGHAEAVTALLDAGADPNAQDKGGRTPLHIPALIGDGEAVTALVKAGANPNAQNENGSTPLHFAAKAVAERAEDVTWYQKLMELFRRRAPMVMGRAEAVTALLDAGADPNAQDRGGRTPLHEVARSHDAEVITALVNAAGADPNEQRRDGRTPLHVAAENGDGEAVTVLVNTGADPKESGVN